MLKRVRDGTASVLAIVFLGYLLIAAAFIGHLIAQERKSIDKEGATSEAYARARDHFKTECTGRGFDEERLVECLEKQIETAREPERAEEDLEAQKQMAFWTTAMGVSGVVFGLPSLLFAGAALIFARRAWQTANKHLSISERPWLSVDIELDRDPEVEPGGFAAAVRFLVTNHGKTVATNVLFETTMIHDKNTAISKIMEIQEDVRKKDKEFRRDPSHRNFGQAVFPGETYRKVIQLEIPPDQIADTNIIWPTVVGSIPYISPADDQTHQTGFVFKVFTPDANFPGGRHAIHLDEGPVTASSLNIEQSLVSGVVD